MKKEYALIKAKKYREWAEARKLKAKELYAQSEELRKSFDFTEPIKVGHHSERRHRKVFYRRDNLMRSIIENDRKIKRMLEKAENLETFANTHKGDAERRRDALRVEIDKALKVGNYVTSVSVRGRNIRVVKIFKKNIRVFVESENYSTLVPKHWVQLSTPIST